MIHLTPEIMEAAYRLLCETAPFKRWKLPHADEIGFIVSRTRRHMARHLYVGDKHEIEISSACAHTLETVIRLMAHEMCHLRDRLSGGRGDIEHGSEFNRLADQVCRHHGFDRGAF